MLLMLALCSCHRQARLALDVLENLSVRIVEFATTAEWARDADLLRDGIVNPLNLTSSSTPLEAERGETRRTRFLRTPEILVSYTSGRTRSTVEHVFLYLVFDTRWRKVPVMYNVLVSDLSEHSDKETFS